MAIAQPQTVARLYRDFDDFLRIRQFLIDTYRLNGCYHNWEIRRWEGQWFWGDLASSLEWAAGLRIWETEQGEIAGAVHADWPGSAVLQVHPTFRHLEEEMLAWAESHLALPNAEGKPQLEMEVYDYDLSRQELLARRGYAKTGGYGYLRWRTLAKPIPAAPPTPGYVLRSLNTDVDDAVRYAAVVNTVFPRSCSTPEVVVRFSASPSYCSDLHLVAEAEDGTFAAFASLTVDSANRTAIFEPVGTHPNHRRKHLAEALMVEGLHRLKPLGVDTVYVGTGDMIPANRLYEALGFTDYAMTYNWRKIFDEP